MKTIPVEELGERLSSALERQDEGEAIRLTKNADTVAWLLRVPEALRDAAADVVAYREGQPGQVVVVLQGKPVHADKTPVFGAGRGSLTVISDDDEHLKDFQEYME